MGLAREIHERVRQADRQDSRSPTSASATSNTTARTAQSGTTTWPPPLAASDAWASRS